MYTINMACICFLKTNNKFNNLKLSSGHEHTYFKIVLLINNNILRITVILKLYGVLPLGAKQKFHTFILTSLRHSKIKKNIDERSNVK